MAFIVRYLYDLLRIAFEEHIDPRVQHWPLLGSPLPMAAIVTAYLVFVLHFGPNWMKHRQAYDLKYVMRIYNAVQVVANLFLCYHGIKNSYLRSEFSFTCQLIDHANTESWMMTLLRVTYGYYLTKYLDLLDTVFFILRKKNNQITFLHVYHHAGMVFAVYAFTTFMAGSHSTMLGAINMAIHTVMYSYYFVTSLGKATETIWWKRHITQLQLLQFGYLIVHFLIPIVLQDCQHSQLISFIGLTQNLFMFILFFDFYFKNYIRFPKKKSNDQLLDKEMDGRSLKDLSKTESENTLRHR